MISKSELIHMLWGLTLADDYWSERNIQALKTDGQIVEKSEQIHARKIGMTFNQIKTELITLQELHKYDIPAVILGEPIPASLRSSKITELIEICRQHSEQISNA